jgi:hypothetical protein
MFISGKRRASMADQQDWHTESYKGMEVHVTALARDAAASSWDYTVRVAWPGDNAASDSELIAKSGDDADYPSKQAAIEAGFIKAYALVDNLNQ